MYQASEDTGASSNPPAVTSVKAASSGAGTAVPAAAKQSLPFVQVTMNDYMDDDDLPATVSFFCYVTLRGNHIQLYSKKLFYP